MIKDYIANAAGIQMPEGDVVKITDKAGNIIWEAAGLPSEYQQVEWIKAAANVGAYIDLGFAFDAAATIHISLHSLSTYAIAYPFGAAENSGVLRCMISCPYSTKEEAYLYGSKGTAYIASSIPGLNTNRHDLICRLKKGEMIWENVTLGTKGQGLTSQTEYTMKNNLYLFAQNYNGNARWGAERKICAFGYYDKNDELICDLIPCYRKSDGEIGMYDLARRLFLTNIGTGTFTKGPDVKNSGGVLHNIEIPAGILLFTMSNGDIIRKVVSL